jgi:hypothetical protein
MLANLNLKPRLGLPFKAFFVDRHLNRDMRKFQIWISSSLRRQS